jgi:hypothetical protein
MKTEVDSVFFFETHYEGQRQAHYGRFPRLERDRLVETTWLTGTPGTRGFETVVTVELTPEGAGAPGLVGYGEAVSGLPGEASSILPAPFSDPSGSSSTASSVAFGRPSSTSARSGARGSARDWVQPRQRAAQTTPDRERATGYKLRFSSQVTV